MGSSHDPDNYRANSEHRRQTRNAGTIRLKQVKNMTVGLLEQVKPENKSTTLQQMERYKILTENLHAWFGSNHVLKDISIKIRENEATAIIGPSGCGKSTLIRCLNRMHELVPGARSTGRVVLDDSNIYAKIEELIVSLKESYTVVIVTHNMQQAARVSDFTAFLYLGQLIEYGETTGLFENPGEELTERYLTGKFG